MFNLLSCTVIQSIIQTFLTLKKRLYDIKKRIETRCASHLNVDWAGRVWNKIGLKSILEIVDTLVIIIIPSCDSKSRGFNKITPCLSLAVSLMRLGEKKKTLSLYI